MGSVYFDYMATTPIDPRVAEVMASCLTIDGTFGNPASNTHRFGYDAKMRVETARQQVAALINASPREIVWTSGATEADNLAIKGALACYDRKGKHIITMATEHKAVLDTCRFLESSGYEVSYLKPQKNGLIDLQELEDSIRDDTVLVSVMHVNNETGVIQDLKKIAEIVKSRGVLLHTDAAQSNGKIEIDVSNTPIDLISLCAHKVYGPKGVGALYVRSKPQVRLAVQIHGGKHEHGMRSGTLATHQLVGMGLSFAIAQSEMLADREHALKLNRRLSDAMKKLDAYFTVDEHVRVPNCLNMSFPKIRSEALMLALPNIALSSGSACNSATPQPSHVLTAMGLEAEIADCAVRLSVGRFTTENDVEYAIAQITSAVAKLRHIVGSVA